MFSAAGASVSGAAVSSTAGVASTTAVLAAILAALASLDAVSALNLSATAFFSAADKPSFLELIFSFLV